MIGRIPASLATRTASAASARSGSIIPNQSSKDQVVFKLFRSQVFWNTIDNLIRTRKDTQGLVSHFRVVCVNYVIDLIINRSDISQLYPEQHNVSRVGQGLP